MTAPTPPHKGPHGQPLLMVTSRAHYYLATPPWDPQKGLWLLIECTNGEYDGSMLPFPIEREHAKAMWPVLKEWAEGRRP